LEFYREHFESIAQDSDAAFQQLFGEAFVRAYDDQIRRLEASARTRR
jgi:predicted component of type VI protein secretion system